MAHASMFLPSGHVQGRDYSFETQSGPWSNDAGREYCRVSVRKQPASEHLPCAIITVPYSRSRQMASYDRLCRIYAEQLDRY